MFFVFGPSGQIYRGEAERLAQVARVRRVRRPQALNTRLEADEDSFTMMDAAGPRTGPAPLTPQANAAWAYATTAQGPAQPRQLLKRVSDVMTQEPITVAPDVRVNDAWHTLARQRIAQAPVVTPEGRVIGLLLRADMAPLDLLPEPGAVRQAIALARRPVAEVMLSPVPTVTADTDLRRLARVFLDTGLPGLPVTDETGRCTGFVSRTDILRALVADPPLDLWS